MIVTTRREEYEYVLLIVPILAVYVGFFVVPTASSVFYSLTDWNGVTQHFVGFKNYVRLLHDEQVRKAFGHTVMYAVCVTIVQNALGLGMAVVLNRRLKFGGVFKVLYFLPTIFPTLVIGYIWVFVLDPTIGAVNSVLSSTGLGALRHDWLGDAVSARWMIILVTVWQNFGRTMIIHLAGLKSIPEELYDAADIDGATNTRKFLHIQVPLLMPAFTVTVTLVLMNSLKIFDSIFALTGGGPGFETDSVATVIYEIGFGQASLWGYGTAMSVVLFVVILALSTLVMTTLRKREVQL